VRFVKGTLNEILCNVTSFLRSRMTRACYWSKFTERHNLFKNA